MTTLPLYTRITENSDFVNLTNPPKRIPAYQNPSSSCPPERTAMKVEMFNAENWIRLQEQVQKWLEKNRVKVVSTAVGSNLGWCHYTIIYEAEQ